MDEYTYPKSGYAYYAVKLIYGSRSPHLEQFSVFGLPPHSDKRMRYSETESRRPSDRGPGINESLRHLNLDGTRMVQSRMTESTGINTALAYQHTRLPPGAKQHEIDLVTDIMFSQEEYDYFNLNWNEQVQYKVDILARLIKALDTGDANVFPMFLDDFPKISRYLISDMPSFDSRESLWEHE